MTDTADVTIRIAQSKSETLNEIVGALEKLGLADVQCHARFMMVNGRIDASRLEALRQVEGVESVREDRKYSVRKSFDP